MSVTELLNTEIKDLDTVESLPVGSVVIDEFGIAWQLAPETGWHPATSQSGPVAASSILRLYGPTVLLAWLPPEAMSR